MMYLKDALANMIESYSPSMPERNELPVFTLTDIPFAHDYYNNLYTINYMQIGYRMGEILAKKLCKWHTKEYQKEHLSYPAVDRWYNQLSEKEKARVKRYDYQNQKWI
jgi:hypothetical protein